METTQVKLARLVDDPQHLAKSFIEEWISDESTVTAMTSGSTGVPKPIKLQKSDMKKSAEATCRFFGIDSHSNLVLPLSPGYIAGKMMIVRALVSGAKIHIEPASNHPLKCDYGVIDLLPVVPSQIEGLLQSPYLRNVRNLLVGGAPLSTDVSKHLQSLGIKAYASYGMTETCSHVALRSIDTDVYTALPGISFTTDCRGCLVTNRPAYTEPHIVTNDIVQLLSDTTFRWLGRYDNVINSGGIKIIPEVVEKELAQFIPAPFYIVGRPNEKWGEEVVLYIEDNKHLEKEYIYNEVHCRLNKFSIPKEIIYVSEFHRTDSGKIKRELL
jgi:O-succinylbenzoic acid--CoA ligase